ncbi:hypothetical protein Acr_12g0001160 [Actinidia rufa]|uniref:Uncharacterized protein n=1 Tax=Actinidia rufa TaxID=165716 RepID=A0A7J0FFY9_9ERIC|nr:hypothetical protein Acr_12g0001160 [Actinidia rufa]
MPSLFRHSTAVLLPVPSPTKFPEPPSNPSVDLTFEHGVKSSSLLVHDDEPYPSSYLADPPSWTSIPYQLNAKRGDGMLPPYLYASLYELCPNYAHGGHSDAPTGARLQCHRPTTFVHCGDNSLFSFPMHNGCLPDNFNDLFRNRFEECKAAIRAVNNRPTSSIGSNFQRYIEGQALRRDDFGLEDFNVEFNDNVLLARDPNWEVIRFQEGNSLPQMYGSRK